MIDLYALADVNFATPHLRLTPLILAAKHDRPAIVAKLLEYGAKRDATDYHGNTALLYASRHAHDECVRQLLWQATNVNDGSLHEASRNLNAKTVELLLDAGHDPNFGSQIHGDRTPLGELCLLAKAKGNAEALDMTLYALASGGADPLKKSGSMQPIFLALANSDPLPIVERLIQRLMSNLLADPAVIFEQDNLAYSPTLYIRKLVLPVAGRPSRSQRVPSGGSVTSPSGPYPSYGNVPDVPQVNRAFHVYTTTAYDGLLRLLVQAGAKDRFYYTGTEFVQPEDMVGAPDNIRNHENTRRDRMRQIQQSWGDPRGVMGQGRPPIPHRSGNDELHLWGSNPQADMQWWRAEETRQIQNRRAISELLNQHLVQQEKLREEAEKLGIQARNRQLLDREALETEWLAGQLARASQMGFHGSPVEALQYLARVKDEDTRRMLASVTEARLLEHDKVRERIFPDERERAVARRPLEGGLTLEKPSSTLPGDAVATVSEGMMLPIRGGP
jgi:Ankyrin repeats (3 copies)